MLDPNLSWYDYIDYISIQAEYASQNTQGHSTGGLYHTI